MNYTDLKNNPEEYKKWVIKNRGRWRKREKEIKNKYGMGLNTVKRYGFKLAIKIYDKFDRKCVYCGADSNLTIHHLDNKGRNYMNKGLNPNNDEKNLILLCRQCHGRIHGIQSGIVRRERSKKS